MKKYLLILFFVISNLCFSQTFTVQKYLNEPITKITSVNVKIEENDSLVIIDNQIYTKLTDTYKTIGSEYDLISIETGTFGFLSRCYLIKDDKKYLFQHRWYSKSRYKYILKNEVIYLFIIDKNGYTTGERIIYTN